ncbi:hypothetical protein ElyMa_002219600, partial [Elysia marginata]
MQNHKLCKRLVEVREAGCSFDIGTRAPYKRPKSTKQLDRVTDMEILAKANETLLRRIVAKQSYYKREDQLRDYD